MPNGLIFDVDGVLANTESISVSTLNEAFKELHGIILSDEDSRAYMGATARRHVGGLVDQYGLDADIPELIEKHESLFIEELTRTQDLAIIESTALLHRIAGKDDWIIGLATSSTRSRSKMTIRACDIDEGVLAAWLTGDDIARSKPDPEIYLACALAMGVPAAQCVVIEDSVAGLTSAKAAGMVCIALTGTFPGEALRDADQIVDSLGEVDLTMLYDLLHEMEGTER